MAFKRKITFHSLVCTNDADIRPIMLRIFEDLRDLSKNPQTKSELNVELGNGDSIQVTPSPTGRISENTTQLFGQSRFIKYNDLPSTYRREDGDERALADNEDEIGILEETHFVIDLSYNVPIIAVETCQAGPKVGNIKNYLTHWCRKLSIDTEVNITPIIGRTVEEFVTVLKECASLELKVRKQNIDNIKEGDKQLGTILEYAQDYANTDYVSLIVGFDWDRDEQKNNTQDLLSRVKNFLNIQKKIPDFLHNFDTAQIRAKEGEEQLKIYDLIMDRTAAEVHVKKRSPKSKYYDSSEMYNEIGKEIKRNFRTGTHF